MSCSSVGAIFDLKFCPRLATYGHPKTITKNIAFRDVFSFSLPLFTSQKQQSLFFLSYLSFYHFSNFILTINMCNDQSQENPNHIPGTVSTEPSSSNCCTLPIQLSGKISKSGVKSHLSAYPPTSENNYLYRHRIKHITWAQNCTFKVIGTCSWKTIPYINFYFTLIYQPLVDRIST